jgi:hypothetical protein
VYLYNGFAPCHGEDFRCLCESRYMAYYWDLEVPGIPYARGNTARPKRPVQGLANWIELTKDQRSTKEIEDEIQFPIEGFSGQHWSNGTVIRR